MPAKSQFIIVTHDSEIHYYQGDFSSIELPATISGLYAYIAYETADDCIYVLSPFKNYASSHAGIALLFNQLKDKRLQFFIASAQERVKQFAYHEPIYGGEVLIEEGIVRFWNYKSGSYSSRHGEYKDSNPRLKEVINSSLFPAESFMKTKDADTFTTRFLNSRYFDSEGKSKTPEQIGNKEKIKQFLAEIFTSASTLPAENQSEMSASFKLFLTEKSSPLFFRKPCSLDTEGVNLAISTLPIT